jgi:hypothetical protein
MHGATVKKEKKIFFYIFPTTEDISGIHSLVLLVCTYPILRSCVKDENAQYVNCE